MSNIKAQNKTLESYNRYAKEYDDKFSVYVPYKRQIDHFISLFEADAEILDAGCGTGLNSQKFSDAGFNTTGFDFSASMIELAKKNCPQGDFTVSTVQQFDSSKKFDGICLSFIIVHLSDNDAEDLIKRIPFFLKPNGYVYISFMTGRKAGYETTSFSDSEIFFNYYEPEKIVSLFEKMDFIPVHRDTEVYEEEDGSTTEDVFLIFRKK